jgi:hypothetical protein
LYSLDYYGIICVIKYQERPVMSFHIFIIALQLAAIAAFLILWYFWVKRKMGVTYGLDEEENVLFPFRHFSWILIGVVLVTCLVQIHFVRVSASVYQKLVKLTKNVAELKRPAQSPVELQAAISDLRAELKSGFSSLEEINETQIKLAKIESRPATVGPAAVGEKQPPKKDTAKRVSKNKISMGFNTEAKASSRSASRPARAKRKSNTETVKPDYRVYSMNLNLMGKVKASALNVRKRPARHSLIVEKLEKEQVVKVTEKRISGPSMWYRIITPTGRAGWVDYRYLKLERLNTDKIGA